MHLIDDDVTAMMKQTRDTMWPKQLSKYIYTLLSVIKGLLVFIFSQFTHNNGIIHQIVFGYFDLIIFVLLYH